MKYAIIESGGKQYKAVEGGTIELDRLPVTSGAVVRLEQILLLADGDQIAVGTPILKGDIVWARVLEHFKGKKVTIFQYRPKKRIRVKTGHRQNYTRLSIEQVGGSELAPKPVKTAEPVVEKAKTKKKAAKAAPIKAETKKAAKPAPAKTEAKKATRPVKPAPTKAKPSSSPKGQKTVKTAPAKAEQKKTVKPAPKKIEPTKKTIKTSPAKAKK